MKRPAIIAVFASMVTLLFSACASPPHDYFYTLSANAAQEQQRVAALPAVRIAIGRITLTELVDRPQLVLQVAANEVTVLEQRRWAQALKTQIPHVVADNLSYLLNAPQVAAYPRTGPEPEYQVTLDVQRFDSRLGDGVTLDLLWNLRRPQDGAMRQGRATVELAAPTSDYAALVAAHSGALATASRAIAQAIADLAATPSGSPTPR